MMVFLWTTHFPTFQNKAEQEMTNCFVFCVVSAILVFLESEAFQMFYFYEEFWRFYMLLFGICEYSILFSSIF